MATPFIARNFVIEDSSVQSGENIFLSVTVEYDSKSGTQANYSVTFREKNSGTNFSKTTDFLWNPDRGPSVSVEKGTFETSSTGDLEFTYKVRDTSNNEDVVTFGEETKSAKVLPATEAGGEEGVDPFGSVFQDRRDPVRFEEITSFESPLLTAARTGEFNLGPESFELKYDQPNISVDSSARFNEHETIDGPVVRQKVGTSPRNIDVSGVCTTAEAEIIDALHFEDEIYIDSNRIDATAQVASTSTSPLEDGGAIDMEGEFTHEFSISLVEVS